MKKYFELLCLFLGIAAFIKLEFGASATFVALAGYLKIGREKSK